MAVENVNIDIGQGKEITIETGKFALLADGSVTLQQGDVVVLVTSCSSEPREGIDFFPLQVEYREKYSAAGIFPGGFIKREGRLSEKEVLTSRMTDRPLRALFPEDFMQEVQIMASLLSADGENEGDVLCMLGASAALCISEIPFGGPIGALRVGRINGEFVANPTQSEMEESDIELVYAGVEGKTIMIEGDASEISEEELRDALLFADGVVREQCEMQRELVKRVGRQKASYPSKKTPEEVSQAVEQVCSDKLKDICAIPDKQERTAALDKLYEEMVSDVTSRLEVGDGAEAVSSSALKNAFDDAVKKCTRKLILEEEKRADGRGKKDLRPLSCEVGLLPRTHGSALFSRGETQALVSTTLGGDQDAQGYDDVVAQDLFTKKRFMLHYNFPPFSVGECGRIGPPGRREIGHGALAERCIAKLLPEDSPYTVRCVSDIMGSNGSTSMASVCGGSLSLMDAGIQLKQNVAGISVGLVTDDQGQKVFLTDILGSEDHYGDMDLKLAGSRDGVTGFQLDLKIPGLDIESMYTAMLQAREARMKILDSMDDCIPAPREEINQYAPKVRIVDIDPENISTLIGPGGKVIKEITETSGTHIEVEEDGRVKIFSSDKEKLDFAEERVRRITEDVETGKIYRGEVKVMKDFGAIVEILPGQTGLLHISEMADYHVDKPQDICDVGDTVTVKVKEVDKERGRISLSRKDALEELE